MSRDLQPLMMAVCMRKPGELVAWEASDRGERERERRGDDQEGSGHPEDVRIGAY